MKIEYQRNLKKSYMKLQELGTEGGYEEKVLLKNKIPGLLSFQCSYHDGEKEYWYETGGRQSLDLYAEVNQLDEKTLRYLLSGICQVVGSIEKYLLDANHLLLQAETIFVKLPQKECLFCYCPVYEENLLLQLRRLAEFLITKVDHKSDEAVKFVYAFYELAIQEDFKMEDFKKLFQMNQGSGESELFAQEETGSNSQRMDVPEKRQKNIMPEERQRNYELEEKKEMLEIENKDKKSPAEFLFSYKEKIQGQIQASIQEAIQQISNYLPVKLKQKEKEKPFLFEPEEETIITEHPTVLLAKTTPQTHAMLIYEGVGEQKSLVIEQTPFVVGSDAAKADGVINNRSVSRQHARITKEGGVYFIEDLNSTNGTTVGGEELNYKVKVGLQSREQIVFANEPYRFC